MMRLKVLVVGQGGRESALVRSIVSSQRLETLYVAPGNPLMMGCERVNLEVNDLKGINQFVKEHKIDLVVCGPEYPLSLGLSDLVSVPVFGPCKEAAQIETSKQYAKQVMSRAGVRTPRSQFLKDASLDEVLSAANNEFPIVIKSDGLAAGKGVFVAHNRDELTEALREVAGTDYLVDQFISGREISLIAMISGDKIVALPISQDYKRIFDDNKGPNTGGMGSVCPAEMPQGLDYAKLIELYIRPIVDEFTARGVFYQGFLYAGLMVPDQGLPYVIEYNARMGDPECQSVLAATEMDLLDMIVKLCHENDSLPPTSIIKEKKTAVTVVIAGNTYPQSSLKGEVITFSENGQQAIAGMELDELGGYGYIMGAGVVEKDGEILTNGGRILNVVGIAPSFAEARECAYQLCDEVRFKGKYHRSDIGGSNRAG